MRYSKWFDVDWGRGGGGEAGLYSLAIAVQRVFGHYCERSKRGFQRIHETGG